MRYIIDNNKLNVMLNNKGFIAALDQSGGSTPKALKNYGIDESFYTVDNVKDENKMFDLVHEMRTRIIKSPAFNNNKIYSGSPKISKTLLFIVSTDGVILM